MQAISFTQLALDQVQLETSKRHGAAIKEARILGLIDCVRYETRIHEALITLKGVRESPGLGIAVRGFIPACHRGAGHQVDAEPSRSDVLAESRSGDAAAANDPWDAPTLFDMQPFTDDIPSAAREASAGVGA